MSPPPKRPTTTKATTSVYRNCPTGTDFMHKEAIGVCLTFCICAGSAFAQRGMNMRISGPPTSGNFSHHHFARPFWAGFPYWSDFASSSETMPAVIVVPTPAPPAQNPPAKSEEPKSLAPLMIEWQGDRYVRRTTASENSRADQPDSLAEGKPAAQNNPTAMSARMESKQSARSLAASAQPGDQTTGQSKKPQAPTTFVFRDG